MRIEEWGGLRSGKKSTVVGTWWPSGTMYLAHEHLRQQLATSARFHAQQAIHLFVSEAEDEALQAAISVGCSVELLTKAYLATVTPSVLADRNDRDAILVMADKANYSKKRVTEIKTIGAHEALVIAKYIHPTLPYNPHADQIVLQVRNAAAHMAVVDRSELRAAVVTMCRIIEALLLALGLDRDPFWGAGALPVVDDLLDAAKSEVRRIVSAKVAAARRRLAEMTAGIDEATKAVLLAAWAERQHMWADHDERHVCPVCQQMGWLQCGVDQLEPEGFVDEDGEGYFYVPRIAFPFGFHCGVCHLELSGEEIEEFNFPDQIELDPGEVEPDEDFEWDPRDETFRRV